MRSCRRLMMLPKASLTWLSTEFTQLQASIIPDKKIRITRNHVNGGTRGPSNPQSLEHDPIRANFDNQLETSPLG